MQVVIYIFAVKVRKLLKNRLPYGNLFKNNKQRGYYQLLFDIFVRKSVPVIKVKY